MNTRDMEDGDLDCLRALRENGGGERSAAWLDRRENELRAAEAVPLHGGGRAEGGDRVMAAGVDREGDAEAGLAQGKKARDKDEAWKLQETWAGKPHAWVQWKGTAVCMDVYCRCGHHSHVDAEFAYHVKCPACGAVYLCNGHIELIEMDVEPDTCVVQGEY